MKKILPFFLFIVMSLQANTQDITVSPNPFVENFSVDMSDPFVEVVAHTTMTNNSDETLRIRWDVIPAPDCPAEWASLVCDKNNCYLDVVITNQGGPIDTAVVLAPNESALFDFHLKPKGIKGCCLPTIETSNFDDNSIKYETIEFDICIDDITSDVAEQERQDLKIFPNPTPNFISISNDSYVEQLWVSNILGKRIRTFNTSPSNTHDVSTLPDGIYLVSMVDEDKQVLKTVRIIKKAVRP